MWNKVQNTCQRDRTFNWCGLYKCPSKEPKNHLFNFNWSNQRSPAATPTPIPLVSVKVNASVVHAVAQVEVIQIYINSEDQPIEAIYYFPVNPDGAVTHFQAELEGRLIKGEVKPHDEAKNIYDQAVQSQKTAFLGEENNADIFKISVGFLKPDTTVKITLGYVTEVKNDPASNSMRFYIPTTIAPRYVPPSSLSFGVGVENKMASDVREMPFSSGAPAPFTLKAAVSMQGGIKRIDCPSHKIKMDESERISENGDWHKVRLALDGLVTEMDRDFTLDILPEEIHKPRLYSEKIEDGSTAVMLHLIPSFRLDEQQTELIFVLDRSGSMMGSSIELARKALLLFLHSMPMDCYFNIVGFGSNFEFLFPQSMKYDQASLSAALTHANYLQSNMGGTKILQPFQAIYGRKPVEGYLRQIFLLTDGQVHNTDDVLGIVQANCNKARVFSLGIGDAASHALVEGVAKAGGGMAAFVALNESMDRTVLTQLKNALQPSLTDIEIDWIGVKNPPLAEKTPTVVINKDKTLLGYNKPVTVQTDLGVGELSLSGNKQSPKRIPPIHDGCQLLVFGLFKDEIPSAVGIKAQSPDGPLTIKIDYSQINDVGATGMLHRLAAVKLIRELELESAALPYLEHKMFLNVSEERERLKQLITGISCEYGVTSKFTSFVAVDNNPGHENQSESSELKNCHWQMKTRTVPNQMVSNASFGGGFLSSMFKMSPQQSQMQQQQPLFGSGPSPFFGSAGSSLFGSGAVPFGSTIQQTQKISSTGFSFGAPSQQQGQSSSSGSLFGSTATMTGTPFSFSATANPPPVTSTTTSIFGQSQQPQFQFAPQAQTPTQFGGGIASFGSCSTNGGVSFGPGPFSFGSGIVGFGTATGSATSTTPLMKLISLQAFDGSFQINSEFCDILGKSGKDLTEAATKLGVKEEVYGTALAIAYFEGKLSDEKDIWELVVNKAKKWLLKQLSEAEHVKKIIELASEFLK